MFFFDLAATRGPRVFVFRLRRDDEPLPQDPHRKHPPIDIAALEADATDRIGPHPKDLQLPVQVRHAATAAEVLQAAVTKVLHAAPVADARHGAAVAKARHAAAVAEALHGPAAAEARDAAEAAEARYAALVAEGLKAHQPIPPAPPPTRRPRFQRKVPLTDAEIEPALERVDQIGDPVICELAREGARSIQVRRRGAQLPRKNSDHVTRRLKAFLQAYGELSSNLQKHPTGRMTLCALRERVLSILGFQDKDDVISEEIIKKDIAQVRPLLRLIQRGLIPPLGKPIIKNHTETRREIEAGKRAAAKAATAEPSPPEPPLTPATLKPQDF
jgi:hypothetical protein